MTSLGEGKQATQASTPQAASTSTWAIPSSGPKEAKITFDGKIDFLALSEITFEWGDSYDDKDWEPYYTITICVDYTQVNGHKWDSMPAEDFVGIMSHLGFVGDPLVHTQHHIGASKWQMLADGGVIGHHQLRAAHQRYTDRSLQTVVNKGHGHAMIQHLYRKFDGQWKLAGLKPAIRWNEFESEKSFPGL